jgi:hypothetical protein
MTTWLNDHVLSIIQSTHFTAMQTHCCNPSTNSSIPSNIPDNTLDLHLSTHAALVRFILWQKQFKLISNQPSSWTSSWNIFYETYEILINEMQINNFGQNYDHEFIHAIHIDVIRLSRYITEFADDDDEYRRHLIRIERILALFASYNSPDGYHQGYHEILAILYYVTIKGGSKLGLDLDHCEAIAYFLLHALINGTIVGDFFLNDQNNSVLSTICHRATKALARCDHKLARAMEANGIDTQLFAYPWIKILFAQTYTLKIVLILWDFLFTQLENLPDILVQVIVAHIASIRTRLIGQNFIAAMIILNRFQVQTERQFTDIFRHLTDVCRCSGTIY